MNNVSLQGDLVMDSGATSHMSSDVGILTTPKPLPIRSFITVGNGSYVLVTQTGDTSLSTSSSSFNLHNIIIVPHLIENLILVYKFTTNNSCSIEFDPFGFFC